jgi:hypothetical protein
MKNNPQDKSFTIAAKEATLAQHAGLRDPSLKMADCSSELISRSFGLTFSFSWINYTAITPLSTKILGCLKINKFFRIYVDVSNRKDT